MLTVVSQTGRPTVKFPNMRKRQLEKKRIQTLKMWHENVKKIAKSEVDFITSIFQDDKNSEDRDWIRDDETEEKSEGDGEVVEKDS